MAAVVPRGTIRLTTSVNFGVRHLAPAIAEFLARHAEVRFDVSLSDRVIDLIEEGFDLAVRIGTTGSENVVARKLGDFRTSMLNDAEAGRPLEVEGLLGVVVELAEKLGEPVPASHAVYALARALAPTPPP